MKIAIFGTGYVGLVSGVCYAEMGIEVTCVDINQQRITDLNSGIVPIYEPGLHEMLEECIHGHRIKFTTDAQAACTDAEACFICVGTPMSDDGQADLTYVEAVARTIGTYINNFTVVVTKSTVPVGTSEKVRAWMSEELALRESTIEFTVASNPEFLKEGAAIDDFMRPDRIVIGVDDPRSESVLHDIYDSFIRNGMRIYSMDIPSAEMTKYASNCMLATKISFINEMANICEVVGADVRQVRQGVGSDSRIGMQFLHPGIGYGGSCFPKDVRALIYQAESSDYTPQLLESVDAINTRQKNKIFQKIQSWCELCNKDISTLNVAVWGLSFKPNTDDIRDAPSINLVRSLLEAGASVRAHDPQAMDNAKKELGRHKKLSMYDDPYDASEDADILCVVTEWRPFRRPNFRRLADQLRSKVIFDGRNLYDSTRLIEVGLQVFPIGVAVESKNTTDAVEYS
ncbi:MAG: UDP-glucose/GDP-mannose dehydrogenase family protein [Planctomycetes bacterium]|nr:UDP-glucose/GDP-mannose dehydrogenase family protein [Planctomycetota bacterium]